MLPWWIGFAVILAAVAYTAYRFACLECAPAGTLEFIVLAIYLGLMYLTFKSQADSETD